MKILIGLLLLSLHGCIPNNGGLIAPVNNGAIPPNEQFPEDYSTLQTYFSGFEAKTPSTDYTAWNSYFSQTTNIVTPSTATVMPFLQNGLYQNLYFSNPQGLPNVTVDFDLNSLAITNFYYLSTPTYIPIDPPPETEIPIGTIVSININATENGVSSTRWQNAYMLKIQNGSTFWYVWYGNQNPVYTP